MFNILNIPFLRFGTILVWSSLSCITSTEAQVQMTLRCMYLHKLVDSTTAWVHAVMHSNVGFNDLVSNSKKF